MRGAQRHTVNFNVNALLAALKLAEGMLPLLRTTLEGHAGSIAAAGLQTGEAVITAVQSKASPDSLQAAATAAMATAQAAGLSANDQGNVGAVAASLSAYAPVVSALVAAGMPDHATIVAQAVAGLQAVAAGVTSAIEGAQPAPAAPAAD